MRTLLRTIVIVAICLFGLAAVEGGRVTDAQAESLENLFGLRLNTPVAMEPPLGLLYGTDREKLGLNTRLIHSPLHSTRFGLSLNPEAIALGARQKLNDKWILLANLAWIKSENEADPSRGPAPDVVVPMVWDETTRYMLGVIFVPADRWTFHAKVSLDRPGPHAAIDDNGIATDQSRLWVATAVNYHIRDDLSFVLEYTRLAVKDGDPFSHDAPRDASVADEDAAQWCSDFDAISALLTIAF